MPADEKKLTVQSVAFSDGAHIPPRYTCDGDDINPPFEISDIPRGTKSLALIAEDPDAPRGVFDHWLLWNISPNEAISEKTNQGIAGVNGFGEAGYVGPCPPSGSHRYYFKIYALDIELDLAAGSAKQQLQDAMKGHVLASGQMMGLYKRNK